MSTRRQFWRYFALTLIATAGAALWRHSFTVGDGDQVTHSLWGISWADATGFVNDWTVAHVVMPHWFFDVVTYLGERFQLLKVVYWFYWLLSVAALSAGLVLLAARAAPHAPWLSILAGPCIVAGPVALAGSTTPVLGIAIPHYLGASLAILSLGFLSNSRVLASVAAGFLTVIVHMQHGFDVGVVMLAAGCLQRLDLRSRKTLIIGALGIVLASFLGAARPGLLGASEDLLRVCKIYIPFHCYAASWTAQQTIMPFLYFSLVLVIAFFTARKERLLLTALLLPVLIVSSAILVDRYSVPVLGDISRMTNAYRFIAYFYPFASLLMLSALAARSRWLNAVALLLMLIWFGGESALYRQRMELNFAALLLITVVVRARRVQAINDSFVVAAGLCLIVLSAGRPNFARTQALEEFGRAIRHHVPVGEVIIAAPSLAHLRLSSRRAVIAEWKTRPFGGEALLEWERRIGDLGGYAYASEEPFRRLPIERIVELSQKYGASFLLLSAADPKLAAARQRWKVLAELPGGFTLLQLTSLGATPTPSLIG